MNSLRNLCTGAWSAVRTDAGVELRAGSSSDASLLLFGVEDLNGQAHRPHYGASTAGYPRYGYKLSGRTWRKPVTLFAQASVRDLVKADTERVLDPGSHACIYLALVRSDSSTYCLNRVSLQVMSLFGRDLPDRFGLALMTSIAPHLCFFFAMQKMLSATAVPGVHTE